MNTYTISTNSLRGAILCAPTADIRAYLNGVQLLAQGAEVIIRATTGRIAFEDLQPAQVVVPINIIIPIGAAKQIGKSKSPTVALTRISEGLCECAGVEFAPADGFFPDVARIMPRHTEARPPTMPDYDWTLVALLQKAMRAATGRTGGMFAVQHPSTTGAALMHLRDAKYPRCAVMPLDTKTNIFQ